MNQETRNNLEILGGGSAPGGDCMNAVIKGQGTINGNLDCINLKFEGISEVNGNVKARNAIMKGAAVVKGSLEAEEIEIGGKAEIRDQVKAKELRVDGLAEIKGAFSGEEIKVKGAMNIQGDCTAEIFIGKGAFTIGGLLNAGKIEISLYDNSRVKEIGGGSIRVNHGDDVFGALSKIFHTIINRPNILSAESIEGDDIYLEYTKAKVVRGNNVNIGPGCEIELVEYRNQFHQSGETSVMENKKIGGNS